MMNYLNFFLLMILASSLFKNCTFARTENNPSFKNVPLKTDSCSDRVYVLIATVDGNLTAMDFSSGYVCWSISLDKYSFLSSSLSNLQVRENENLVDLVPSLDGHFFKYDKLKLTPLNVTVEDVLYSHKSLFPFTESFGGKFKFVFGIDRQTGEIAYNCSINGCESLKKIFPEDIIVVEEIVRIVNSIDSVSAELRWNLKVSELHISKTTLKQKFDSSLNSVHNHSVEPNAVMEGNTPNNRDILKRIKVSLMKGVVAVLNEDSIDFSWLHKSTSPIIDVWLVDQWAYLLDPFATNSEFFELEKEDGKHIALLYLGFYLDQLFIIQSKKLKLKSNNDHAVAKDFSYEAYCLLRPKEVKPTLEQPNTVNALIPADSFISDAGHYFYVNFSVYENETHCIVGFSYPKYSSEIMDANFWFKLCLIVLLMFSVLLGFVLGCLHVKKNSSKSTAAAEVMDLASKSPAEEDFVSRFQKEFHFVALLGKGGYGVVMEAKNKIDDCNYAVKRIRIIVDGRKEQRYDGVLREVKALAKLDHPHIVRYFNSWVENPPEGWQDERDKELNISDVTCSIDFSTYNPDDTKEKIYESKSEEIRKVGSFELTFSDKTSNFENKRASKIAHKLKMNPLGVNFEAFHSFQDINSALSSDESPGWSTEEDSDTIETVDFSRNTSSTEEYSQSSAYVAFLDEDLKELDDSNSNLYKIKSLRQLQDHLKKYQLLNNEKSNKNQINDYTQNSNDNYSELDNLSSEKDAFMFLKLINSCLIYKLSEDDLLKLKRSIFYDISLTKSDKKNWLNYTDIFQDLDNDCISTKMYKMRVWIISVICLLTSLSSYPFELLKINLCNILWDVNLTLDNSPYSYVSKNEFRFTSIRPNNSRAKNAVFSSLQDLNLKLSWPMKKKYLLLFSIFLFNDPHCQKDNKWKTMFSQTNYSVYIINLRLLEIWILSILIHFKSHKGRYIEILLHNLSYIFCHLMHILTYELIESNKPNYPLDAKNCLFVSTIHFSEKKLYSENEIMFHQKQLQETLKRTMLKKYNQPGYLYIQMQLCQRESFESWLYSHSEKRNYEEIMKIYVQIIDAMDYVHACGLMHRDLKPSNIYFSKEGLIKIGDFGLATQTEVQQDGVDTSSTDGFPSHTHGIGTPTYLSPEQCSKKIYNSKTDMYSLGLIFYELLLPMRTSFEKRERFESARRHMFPPEFIQEYPRECEIIRRLLSYDPDLRPSASELKCHPLFQPYLQQLKN